MDPDEILAQDPNAPDGQQEVDQEAKRQAEGIQLRINELTQKAAEAERRAQELAEQNNALLVAGLTRQQAPVVQEADPYEGMDPDLAKVIRAAVGATEKKFSAQVAAAQAQVAQLQQLQWAQAAQAAADRLGLDEEQRAAATKLKVGMNAKGIPMNDEDAAIYVLGQATLKARQGGGTAPAPRHNATITSVRSPNLAPTRELPALPSNFDDLEPDAQIAILAKRGAHNQKL